MNITDGALLIRLMTVEDLPLLLKWLGDDRVLQYYGGRDLRYTMETLTAHYTEPFEGEGFRVIAAYDGIPIGYGQIYRVCGDAFDEYSYPDTGACVFAMDQFIGEPEYWNRGIGTEYTKAICAWLAEHLAADAVILDPRASNRRAIRAYEKAGFRIIGTLCAHELFEGQWEDCLLMEWCPSVRP